MKKEKEPPKKIKKEKEPLKELEINILSKFKEVNSFKVDLHKKTFMHDGKKYNINTECIYLIPFKETFIPSAYYKENHKEPLQFKNENKGIPSRALHLLWNHTLYRVLVALENDKTNLFVVILLVMNLVINGIALYLKYGGQ